jgi:hypothetical protein
MARRRGPILAVSVAIGVIDLIATVATPYLTLFAVDVGLGRSGIYLAVFGASLLEIIVTAVGNLALVQLYFRIARAHDGVAPGEVEHLFA